MVPPRGDHPIHGHFWIPIDDENCWAWSFDYHPVRALTRRRAPGDEGRQGHPRRLCAGHLPAARQQGQRLPDGPRGAARPASPIRGVEGIAMQDASLQESMGPIVDRTKENLVSTDNGIIMARHRLMKAARALAEKGDHAARRRSGASSRALGRGRAAAGPAVQGGCQGSPARASRAWRRRRFDMVGALRRPVLR